ncbi:MAG: cysteine hydrolase family protein [Alphaproteobacteria bacterium]
MRIPAAAVHVAIDMQRVFAEPSPWRVPSFGAALPNVLRLAAHAPARTILTRFVTPRAPAAARGAWRGYYERWRDVTLERMPRAMLDIVPPLAALSPPATTIDKRTYSAFAARPFLAALRRLGGDTLILSGVETDVCVLATVYDAVDRGLNVIVATDAIAAFSRPSHRAMLGHVYARIPDQVALLTTGAILAAWRRPMGARRGGRLR